jgi:hypothetical protein
MLSEYRILIQNAQNTLDATGWLFGFLAISASAARLTDFGMGELPGRHKRTFQTRDEKKLMSLIISGT